MRARQFRPTLGSLESRISLSDASGGGTAPCMYASWYDYTDADASNPGDYDVSDPNINPIVEGGPKATDGFLGVLIDTVVD